MRNTTRRQLTFGDAELRSQTELSGALKAIADLLDTLPELVEQVHRDLVAGLLRPRVGRHGLGPVQVLRAFILQRLENLDLRALADRIADGMSWRVFTGFDAQPVPRHDAFNRAFTRLTPQTVRQINAIVLRKAHELGLEQGERLRVDTTVVETNIRFPTDAGLLWDCVRRISREVRQLVRDVPKARPLFHDHTTSAKRRYQQIARMTRQERQHQQRPKYKDLIRITHNVVSAAGRVITKARAKAKTLAPAQHDRIVRIQVGIEHIEHFCALAERVLSQTRRRILEGEQVPAQDKLFSIFEPHTDIIVRGKTNKPVEFGHKVFLAESGSGLITEYGVLAGNPVDETHVGHSLDAHRRLFARAPHTYAGDRGFYSVDNVAACRQAGVTIECIPQRGGTKTPERAAYEKSTTFKKGQRFRAGIEGRISVLMRGRGMRRCLSVGLPRFEVFVGLAVLANNLLALTRLLSAPRRRPKRAA